MTIQTACSSSLVSLHEACQALLSKACTTALVGGTSLIWSPTMTDCLNKSLVLSPSGISHTFDANADGYGRGEAINCIYLKPLKDALRDNDPIRAVIRSTVSNHDGKTPNFTNPCPLSQERLIRRAYEVAGINDIDDTPVFECHGTGTAVGDVIEASVVGKLTQQKDTYITAVSRPSRRVENPCLPRPTGETKRRSFGGSIRHHQHHQSRPVTRAQNYSSERSFPNAESKNPIRRSKAARTHRANPVAQPPTAQNQRQLFWNRWLQCPCDIRVCLIIYIEAYTGLVRLPQ